MQYLFKANAFIKSIIKLIQDTPVSLTYLLLTLMGITLVRNYLELFASQHEFNLNHLIHYTLFFVALAMCLTALFQWITKESVERTARLVVPMFSIIWVAPIIDILISGPGGQQMAYILEADYLIMQYFTFFGPITEFGITLGMRTEIALVLLGALWFFVQKTGSYLKSIIALWLTYTVIFIFVSLPAIISLYGSKLGITVDTEAIPMTAIFLLIISVSTLWLAFKTNPKGFMLIAKDIRPLRWTHFQFMFILGVCLSVYFGEASASQIISPEIIFNWVFVIISITCAWMYSIFINNLEDVEIDAISNPGRPTITQSINADTYRSISWWILATGIASAAVVGFEFLFLVLTFIALYFLYSAPPIRFKRVLVLSKGVIALNSLLLLSAGYNFLNGTESFGIPAILVPIFMIGLTMILNFIDLKDYEGDKQAGIKTLPVVLGMEKAKWIIGTAFITTYLSVYYVVENAHLLPALLLIGLAQYYLVTKETWEEWKVLTLHLVGLALAFVYLLVM